MNSRKRSVLASVSLGVALASVAGQAFADTVVSTTSARGCTATLHKATRVTRDPRVARDARAEVANLTVTEYYAGISCPSHASGVQARAKADCAFAPDRYTSWAVRGDPWVSGTCADRGRGVVLEFR